MSSKFFEKSDFNAEIADEDALHAAFNKVKPICLKILSNGTSEDFDHLMSVLQGLNNESLCLLQQYLIFPVRLIFTKKNNERLTIKCVEFLSHLFDLCPVQAFSTFSNVFRELFASLVELGDIEKISPSSEEYKISVCECTVSLVRNSGEEIIREVFGVEFRLPLAQSLFVLTTLLKIEKSKTLRTSVLEAIGALTYNKQFLKTYHEECGKLASSALASYFPGLTISLQSVVCGDYKQGHSVISLALKILGDLFVLVIGDQCILETSPNNQKSTAELDLSLSVIKDLAWFKTVSEKIKIVLESIILVANHEHWKVRLQFLNFAKLLLFKCSKYLIDCYSIVIPPVLSLYVDDNLDIALNVTTVISDLSEKLKESNSFSLRSVIEDNLYATASKLIKCKLLADDSIKLFTLKSLQGYLIVLNSDVSYILSSTPHLEKIVLCLINFVEFDLTNLNIIEEVSTSVKFDISLQNMWPKKTFVCFQEEKIIKTIFGIVNLLSKFNNARFLIHYLFEKIQSSELYTLQCIYLIGNVIKSLSDESYCLTECTNLINDILAEFLSPTVWDVPIHNIDQECTTTEYMQKECLTLPFKIYNHNAFQICLILEAISNCAAVLKENFRPFLVNVLCPVMEKAGNSSYIISQSGRICLYSIAHFCQYNSVSELIKDNADYITNSIMISFHHFLHKPEVAVVLRVAMEESDATALALFRDSIYQILNLIDLNHDKAYSLLNILLAAVNCISRWFPAEKKRKLEVASSKQPKDLKIIMQEYQNSKSIDFNSMDFSEEKDSVSDSYSEEVNESYTENKNSVPLHVLITTEILKRCIHFQSSKNLFLQMLSLETAESCMKALSDYEQKLHTLVHEFWNPFIQRFSDDTIVILKAFQVLLIIVEECKEFVLVRTLRDIIPKLVNFLKKEFNNSLMVHFANYRWSNAHKLQLLILSEIGNLCSKLNIIEKDLAMIAEVCLPYLNVVQPKVLQNAAEKSLKALSEIDPDAIWFYYNEMYCIEKTINPPHESLNAINFPDSNCSNTVIRLFQS